MTEHLTHQQLWDKVISRFDELIEERIERNPQKYQILDRPDEYNEYKAEEDILDNNEWIEDDRMVELMTELLWRR